MEPQQNTLPGWQELLTETGIAALQQAQQLHAAKQPYSQQQKQLRAAGYHPQLVAAALAQVQLRERAQQKFGKFAAHLLFTPAGLEQASRAVVADYHAARFKQLGSTTVYDLGCGIGMESLALLRAGINVVCYEIDPLTAAFAAHNLRSVQQALNTTATAVVHCADAHSVQAAALTPGSAVFCDPARRTSGHKNTSRVDPAQYAPNLDFLFGLAAQVPTLMKLGPGFARELLPPTAAAEWISVRGEAVETLLTFTTPAQSQNAAGGSTLPADLLLQPGSRHATILPRATANLEQPATAPQALTLSATADSPDPQLGALQEFLYEPDPAVIRARQIGTLAKQLNADLISQDIAYLTTATAHHTPFAQGLRVLEIQAVKPALLAKRLQALGASSVEIKKRGIAIDPAAFRKLLRLPKQPQPRELTLVLTRVAGKHQALICERLAAALPQAS